MKYHIGKTSHASAPEEGCNPAEAIAATVLYCTQLQKEKHAGMVLSTITGIQAGTGDYGISAGEGMLRMTLRAEYEDEMTALMKKILSFAGEQAKAAGLKM